MSTEWKNLRDLIERNDFSISRLDYPAEPYPAAELRERADKTTDPLLARLLADLANNPTALSALNRQPLDVRNLNASMHYLVARKLEVPKRARGRVATAWHMKPSIMKDIFTTHGATAAIWLDNLLEHIDTCSEFATHEDIYRAIDADLTLRASTMGRDFRRKI